MSSREILIYSNWLGIDPAMLIGTLRVSTARDREIFSFSYDDLWLQAPGFRDVDPELQWFRGPQYVREPRRDNFGLFLDSAPDRWGRMLMNCRESLSARKEHRRVNPLRESDYLLGVHDLQRSGGLRLKCSAEGEFLAETDDLTAPPWTSLRDLEFASWQYQTSQNDDPQSDRWLDMLIAPGSSIGGARPKAGVVDNEGHLWIAKFPGSEDQIDIGAWEMVVHTLAKQSGIRVSDSELLRLGRRHHTFITKRFDRVLQDGQMKRIHFASAMTLLGYYDGASGQEGVSYLELAELLMRLSSQPNEDMEELWRRIVFSIGVHNTDDHLRNHGFLLTERGWILSPAYDMNPNPTGNGLTLNISETDNSLDIELAREVAPWFRVSPRDATRIIQEVSQALSNWKSTATSLGISRQDQSAMEICFSRLKS